MMTKGPVVDYRFSDCAYTCDFVTPLQYEVVNISEKLSAQEDYILAVANYIRDNFKYPMVANIPSCDGQLLRYTEGLFRHKFKVCRFYVWGLPCEVIKSGFGYCVETSNLAESLLRVKKLSAWACLGEVRNLSDELMGLHEWVRMSWQDKNWLLETTVHDGMVNMLPLEDAYDKNSQFSQKSKLYYVEKAYFNEQEYHEDGGGISIAHLMKYPPQLLKAYGLEKCSCLKPKKLAREWYKIESRKQLAINNAFGRQPWGVF